MRDDDENPDRARRVPHARRVPGPRARAEASRCAAGASRSAATSDPAGVLRDHWIVIENGASRPSAGSPADGRCSRPRTASFRGSWISQPPDVQHHSALEAAAPVRQPLRVARRSDVSRRDRGPAGRGAQGELLRRRCLGGTEDAHGRHDHDHRHLEALWRGLDGRMHRGPRAQPRLAHGFPRRHARQRAGAQLHRHHPGRHPRRGPRARRQAQARRARPPRDPHRRGPGADHNRGPSSGCSSRRGSSPRAPRSSMASPSERTSSRGWPLRARRS